MPLMLFHCNNCQLLGRRPAFSLRDTVSRGTGGGCTPKIISAALIQAMRSLMLPLQAAQGFMSCYLYQEADDGNTLCYIEEWQTHEDLDRQIRSHFTHLLALMELSAAQPKLFP